MGAGRGGEPRAPGSGWGGSCRVADAWQGGSRVTALGGHERFWHRWPRRFPSTPRPYSSGPGRHWGWQEWAAAGVGTAESQPSQLLHKTSLGPAANRSLLVPAVRPVPLEPGVTPDPPSGCLPLVAQLLTRPKPRGVPGAGRALPTGHWEGRRRGRGEEGRGGCSPAGHGHLHPRGRDGRAQLVQVPDARSAGVAAVHLGGRGGRGGRVRHPLAELAPTAVSELSSRHAGTEVQGGGRGRRRQLAGRRREEAGRAPRAAPREPRVRPGREGEAAGEVSAGLPASLPPSCRQQPPRGWGATP